MHPKRTEAYKNILISLRTHVGNKQDWPQLLSSIWHAFRSTVVAHLGYSPYQIVLGVQPYLSFDNMLLTASNLPTNVQQYLIQMSDRLAILSEIVRRNQEAANIRATTQYNAKSQTKIPIFKTMDRVEKGEKLSHKITPKYRGHFLRATASTGRYG